MCPKVSKATSPTSRGSRSRDSKPLRQHQPRPPTHWEPSRVVPGAGSFAGRRGRFWHGLRRAAAAFMAARRSRRIGRFRVGPDAFGALSDSGVQRKCTTRITSRSSGCCRRRTLPAFVGCRGARSTERLHGASCRRRGSATGSASIRPSWSAGSRARRAGRVRRHRGEFGGAPTAPRVACALCSMKARKARRGR
jgi:hypothetical protein